jgi:hypothetical protein
MLWDERRTLPAKTSSKLREKRLLMSKNNFNLFKQLTKTKNNGVTKLTMSGEGSTN